MNYADIIKALPPDVAALLQAKLDAAHVSPSMSQDEVKELLDDAVQMTRLEMIIADDEKRRLVDSILTMVGPAALKAIFP